MSLFNLYNLNQMVSEQLITVIVPVYNKENQISRCIDSVLSQNYTNWELILVDDGSTDASSEIIKTYLSDDRIIYIYKENGGVSSARNLGMKLKKGQWMIFLDADDYFLPNALELLLNNAIANSISVSSANFFVEVSDKRFGLCEGNKRIIKDNFKAWFFYSYYIRAGSTLFKSSVMTNYEFDESLSRFEDVKFWFDVMRNEKIVFSSDYVMVYSCDNLELSYKVQNIYSDYTFCMDFTGKSFWEKLSLVRIIKQGVKLYPEYLEVLKNKYKKVWYLLYINDLLSVFVYTRIRLIRLLRKFKIIFK